MKSQFLPGPLSAFLLLSSCGSYEAQVQTAGHVESDEVEVLSLAAAAADYFCPSGFSYNLTTRLCESPTEAAGPFTSAMVSKCTAWGGGSACAKSRWALEFARKVRGTEVCPPGATRDGSGLCIEGTFAFGPFLKSIVNLCKESGSTETCEGLRWDKGEALRLAQATDEPQLVDKFTFPFTGPADANYTEAPRSFGSCRDNCTRKHAGVDLYGPVGRPVYAVGDGKVLDFHYFYDGTYALVVDHGDFVVRYGEIKGTLPAGVAVGATVKRGQRVGWVGDLQSLSYQMVHFERYSGKASGPLTVRENPPYQRRSDLQNPTADLIKWKYPR